MLKKISLANSPTPIEKIQFMETDLPVDLYFKRDDFTGSGLSGNKVRKLEYLLQRALEDGITDIITCGAIQSNHCRATALAGAKLGIQTHLVLAGSEDKAKEGNNFLDLLGGAEQKYISDQDYAQRREQIMEDWKESIQSQGNKKAMIIPEGASNGLGSFGYRDCFKEILAQEEEMGIKFDLIAIATGSGGSLAGLVYGKETSGRNTEIVGLSVYGPREEVVRQKVEPILEEMRHIEARPLDLIDHSYEIIDDYIGIGYAKSTIEELEFIRDFTSQTGIILDPVYTGKAAYGLVNEILKNRWGQGKNILFIHTGGAFGWTREQIDRLLGL